MLAERASVAPGSHMPASRGKSVLWKVFALNGLDMPPPCINLTQEQLPGDLTQKNALAIGGDPCLLPPTNMMTIPSRCKCRRNKTLKLEQCRKAYWTQLDCPTSTPESFNQTFKSSQENIQALVFKKRKEWQTFDAKKKTKPKRKRPEKHLSSKRSEKLRNKTEYLAET